MNQRSFVALAAVVALGFGAAGYFGLSLPVTPAAAMSAPVQPAAAPPAPTPQQVAELPPTPDILPQRILGREDAPVTILEFASLTCGHCANFDQHTLPKLRKDYIDSGKVRLVFRDFPLGQLALVAAMVPHCAAPDQYFGFLDVMFRTMPTWAGSNDPLSAIGKVVRMGGMSEDTLHACFNNQALFNAIRDRAQADGKEFGIDATPTFVINGKKVVGDVPYEEFTKIIDAALAAAK